MVICRRLHLNFLANRDSLAKSHSLPLDIPPGQRCITTVASAFSCHLFAQDICHAPRGCKPDRASMSRTLFALAGFQLITLAGFG